MNHLRSAGGHILQTVMKFLVEMPVFLAALFTMHAMDQIMQLAVVITTILIIQRQEAAI